MSGIFIELSSWATTLPFWEQAALEKIIRGITLSEADFDELLGYLLEDEGLREKADDRPQLQFSKFSDDKFSSQKPLRLIKVTGLQNINALVLGQTLTFGPGLTAIYGGNGSGKSGYARVLGCAGFTRGDHEILPDIARPHDVTAILSADIEVTDGASSYKINYKIGDPCPELASFYVFDTTSVKVHLTQANTLSFSPAGLSYLRTLADVTDKVRERLRSKIEEYSRPHSFITLFQGKSDIGEVISALGPNTDLSKLRQSSVISDKEREQIARLDLQIAQLKAQDITEEVASLEQKIGDLRNLIEKLSELELALDDQAINEIQSNLSIYHQKKGIAEASSIDQFQLDQFKQTGSDVWYQFVSAAKALAEVEQPVDEKYPREGDACLLCHQPLPTESRDLLVKLWAFLEGEAQARLKETQTLLSNKRKTLTSVMLDFFNDQSVSYRHLKEYDESTQKKIQDYLNCCRAERQNLIDCIDSHSVEPVAILLPENPIPAIEKIVSALNIELSALKGKDISKEMESLEQKLCELQHRLLLRDNLPAIEGYVQRRIWASKASRVGGSTRHITKKHNELFEKLVTDRYRELFEQTLKELGRSLKIKVVTKGRKGETYKQITLETDPSVPDEKCMPEKVLSEGEKRAVAFADFLTEVMLDSASNGVILDDPVTSLDIEWRRLVASILAGQAKGRQVVVFTHDMPFLYFLKKHAEEEKVEIETHWIKRGDHDNKPGYVFLNNSPAMERDYRKATRAREICMRAKSLPAAEQEALLRDGFGALRTTYEAFIIFDMFAEVVMRFDERISFGRLKDISWDESIANEVILKCESLSKYIEGHLHSDAFNSVKPTPDLLLREIESLPQAFHHRRRRFPEFSRFTKSERNPPARRIARENLQPLLALNLISRLILFVQ